MTISYLTPFVLSVFVVYSQIFILKLNLWEKKAISVVKRFFGFFVEENVSLLFFAEFELLMFHNNTEKISKLKKNDREEFVLPPSYLPYRFLHN